MFWAVIIIFNRSIQPWSIKMQRKNIKWKKELKLKQRKKNIRATIGWNGEATMRVGKLSEVWEEILRPLNWELRNPNSEIRKSKWVKIDTGQDKKANWNRNLEKKLVTEWGWRRSVSVGWADGSEGEGGSTSKWYCTTRHFSFLCFTERMNEWMTSYPI